MPLEPATSSPTMPAQTHTPSKMWTMAIALIPATAMAVWLFGLYALYLIIGTAVASVAIDYTYAREKYNLRRPLGDGTVFVTGMLLGLSLSPTSEWWVPIIGSLLLVVVGRRMFAGMGSSVFHPVLVARTILLLAWPNQLTRWISPFDGVTSATPLAGLDVDYVALIFGTVPGSLGETSVIAILIGAVLLLVRRVISWRIPLAVLAGAAVGAVLFGVDPLFTILSGSLLFVAVFIATDVMTSPVGKTSQLVYGFGGGLLTVLIRTYTVYPAGVAFAFLIMNAAVHLLDTRNTELTPTMSGGKTSTGFRGLGVVAATLVMGVLLGGTFVSTSAVSQTFTDARLGRDVQIVDPQTDRVVTGTSYDSAVETYRVYSNEQLAGHFTTATVDGYGGPLTIHVALDSAGAITRIRIAEDQESPTLGSKIRKEEFLQQFYGYDQASRESIQDNVDTITGATVSSQAVMNGIEKVLAARDESAQTVASGDSGDSITAVSDGVYTGFGDGYQGQIVVEVTVQGGEIREITVTDHQETEGLGTVAMEELSEEIIETQQLPVDAVSGATGSSDGFRKAVADAVGAN